MRRIKTCHFMGKVSDDADEGLGLSLATYLAAIGAAILVLGTSIYFATGPTRLENPGLAAYQPLGRIRLIPESMSKADVTLNLSDGSKPTATKITRR
jgi:hypothetical protein